MNFPFWKGRKPLNEAPMTDKNLRRFMVKAIGLISRQGSYRQDFSEPEYDLEEIKIASASDSYIKQSLMKYTYLIYKAGYGIKSENEKASEYIKQRFRIMSFATSKAMDITFQEVADDLSKYSNAFLIKSRVEVIMPGIRARGVLGRKPVGGYFRVDPASMRIKTNAFGKIEKYQQVVNGQEKLYDPADVVHFYLDREADHQFGTPRISAALEDVKLLRKIEGNVISLIYRFAIPIYQWIVGVPEAGFQATDKEIDDAKREIEKVSLDGMFVTNERTQIKAIGAEGHALNASQYLTYFEKRVFTALGVSESQMGRGGSKQDADSMEAQAHDTVKYIQRILSIFIENYIINELLLEGGFDPVTKENDIVKYEFNETSLETKIKVENHEILKFQSNVTSFEETRRSLGRSGEVEEDRLYNKMFVQSNAIEQIKEKTKGTAQGKTSSGGVAGNGKQVAPKQNNDVENRNRPENQHGKGSAKIKESEEGLLAIKREPRQDKDSHKKSYESLYKRYDWLRNDIVRTPENFGNILIEARGALNKEIQEVLSMSIQAGIVEAKRQTLSNREVFVQNKLSLDHIEKYTEQKINKLLIDIDGKIDAGKDPGAVFNALEYRLRYLIEYVEPKAYWFAFVKSCEELGIEELYVNFNDSKDRNDHPSRINPKKFDWKDIPPYHAFCGCTIGVKEGEKR